MTLCSQEMEPAFSNEFHIKDDVHGYIEVPRRLRKMIDTPQFQRLRDLKQLGATYFIYPGASHNRFEHSLGTMHLAGKVIKTLREKQPELGITDEDEFAVMAAGLLHDLGHGPFSHVFDNQFMAGSDHELAQGYNHEDMSIKMVQFLFDDNEIDCDKKTTKLIQAMISPKTHKEVIEEYKNMDPPKCFLFDIISNESNSIDVDKWDYMLRDSRNMNLGITFNYERMLNHSRVFNDRVCYAKKTHYDIYMLFRTRYELFKRAYHHKTAKSIELMICDIFNLADDEMKIIEKTKSPETFMTLTDSLLSFIEYSPNEKLKPAQKIVHKLRTRHLYKFVGDGLVDPSQIGSTSQKECTIQWSQKIFELCPQEIQEKYDVRDICVTIQNIHYGMQDKNPVECVWLYESLRNPSVSKYPVDEISLLNGSTFSECSIMAFVKHHTMAKSVSEAFKKFYENQFKKKPRIRQTAKMIPHPSCSPDIEDKCYSRRSQSITREKCINERTDLNSSREKATAFSPSALKRKASDLFLSSPAAKKVKHGHLDLNTDDLL